MKKLQLLIFLFAFQLSTSFSQTIQRIDNTSYAADSLQAKIEYLMQAANVSGVAISVFNDSKTVFSKTFGLADVQKKIPFQQNSVMYAASFAKVVFAYIAMKYVQEKVLDRRLESWISAFEK